MWKKQQHIVKIFYMWMYNIKRKKYKTVCAELAFANVTFDRMVMIFYRTWNVFFIFHAVGLLQRVFDQKLQLSLLYFNAWKLFQKCKKLQNVRHIHNVFKFWDIFSTFLCEIMLYLCREYLAYGIPLTSCCAIYF